MYLVWLLKFCETILLPSDNMSLITSTYLFANKNNKYQIHHVSISWKTVEIESHLNYKYTSQIFQSNNNCAIIPSEISFSFFLFF